MWSLSKIFKLNWTQYSPLQESSMATSPSKFAWYHNMLQTTSISWHSERVESVRSRSCRQWSVLLRWIKSQDRFFKKFIDPVWLFWIQVNKFVLKINPDAKSLLREVSWHWRRMYFVKVSFSYWEVMEDKRQLIWIVQSSVGRMYFCFRLFIVSNSSLNISESWACFNILDRLFFIISCFFYLRRDIPNCSRLESGF